MLAFFRLIVAVGLLAALFMWPLPGRAASTSVFADPYPCSVLSPEPCHPTFCSVFSRVPCQPDINYPFGQNLQLTIKSRADEQPAPQHIAAVLPPDDKAAEKNEDAPEHRLNTIGDMFAALRACWVPPAKDDSRPGTQL